jgi:hypothetical protein
MSMKSQQCAMYMLQLLMPAPLLPYAQILVPLQDSWQLWREGELEEIARYAGVQIPS